MPTATVPIRQGKPVCFTLDYDAESLLRTMVQNKKSFGLFVSELIRREAERRVQRHELLRVLALDVLKEPPHE
jgi:hypothetical protein